MKSKFVKLVCAVLAVLMLCGCGPQAPDVDQIVADIRQLGESPDDNYRTYYEVFVYSFCDSDGDGIGDIPGLISKLDYLQKLGIRGIWLMPIHPSSSYHKYNVEDYYAVDPAYGTMEDFENLIAECEKRDIHVIIDLVLNHTGSEHVWFQEAVSYLKSLPAGEEPDPAQCKYLDYYFFSKESGNGSRPVTGTEWYYEGMFDYTMPDVNFGNEAVWDEIEQIMRFWLEKGVAGFRLDAAKEFYSGSVTKNVEVLSRIQQTATSIQPDCYLVAEVWESFNQISAYYESGITSIFNFAFGNSDGKITKVIRGAGNASVVSTYATALETADQAYLSANGNYIDAPFLSNHDVGRIAGFANRDEKLMKLAGAMNLFMSGSAFIYYGEEIGMVAGGSNDPSKRAPMLWNQSGEGMTDPPPECTLPSEYPLGSFEEQEKDPYSIYQYYRQAVAIRNALPVISHGRTTAEKALNQGCVSAQRKTWGEESCLILMNIAGENAQVDLSSYADWTLAASLSVDADRVSLNGTTLELPAYGVAVLIPKT